MITTNTTGVLYQALDKPDRSKTQLMYFAIYMPTIVLPDSASKLIAWKHKKMLYKNQILDCLNEDMTKITFAPPNKAAQQWDICWAFNAIPTQMEWERKSSSYIISCEFRVLLGSKRIVQLSF